MRDTLVMSHLHLVDGVLFELMSRFPRHVDRENLRAAGLLGLVEASRRFDEETGVPFDRYARVRIRGAMLDATRIGLISTRKARRRRRDLESARDALRSRLGREPTAEEVAAEIAVPVDEVRLLGHVVGQVLSLTEVGEDALMVPDHHLPPEVYELKEQIQLVRKAVAALPNPHRMVVKRHLLGGERLGDVAADLGVSCGRASQVRSEAMSALRGVFAKRYEGVPRPSNHEPGVRLREALVAVVLD